MTHENWELEGPIEMTQANDRCSLPKITNPVLSAQPKIAVITMIRSVLKE